MIYWEFPQKTGITDQLVSYSKVQVKSQFILIKSVTNNAPSTPALFVVRAKITTGHLIRTFKFINLYKQVCPQTEEIRKTVNASVCSYAIWCFNY